jgi:bifunctional DNA-binding transcriptional regulator/antitoxin component of YhaV-PrlF toxin-antitoxin module
MAEEVEMVRSGRKTKVTDTTPAPGLPVSLPVKAAGRVLLPAELRATLGVREGDDLVGELRDGELRLMSRATALRRAQSLVRQHVPAGTSLVDEMLAERRAEAVREEAESLRRMKR